MILGVHLFKHWYQSSLRNQILIWLLAVNFFLLALMAGGVLQVSRSVVEKNIVNQLEREHLIEAEIIEAYLNNMISEVHLLGSNQTLVSAINMPMEAQLLLAPILNSQSLIKEGGRDFYLLDSVANRLYAINDHASWSSATKSLAQSALVHHQTEAAILETSDGFVLQIAQPIESRGVFVLSQSINQLMTKLFQGRRDIAAWVLESESGKVISNLQNYRDENQAFIRELWGDSGANQTSSGRSNDAKNAVWKTIREPLRLVPPLENLHLQLVLNERTNWAHLVAMELLPPVIAILLLISLVAFLVITFVGRGLATPLEDLASYSSEIGEFRFSRPIDQTKLKVLLQRQDEVGRLSKQFSGMLERLRLGYAGLEDQVAQRNAHLEAIFTLSPDGFVEINSEGQVAYANPAFEVLTGLPLTEILDRPLQYLQEKLRTLSKDFSDEDIRQLFNASQQFQYLELVIPFARTLAVLAKKNPSHGLVVYLRDVTQEVELEGMRSAFMSTAAHELRTPISNILGYAELLVRRLQKDAKPSQESIEEMAGVIERQSKNMAALVNDLLDLSRFEYQMARGLKLNEASLGSYLRPLVGQFQMHGDVREVVMHIDDHLPDVRLHPDSFKRLIVNLLSNAFKYSPKGSPVIVKTFTRVIDGQSYVGISIQDHGSGIPKEHLEHVFERFYRSSSHAEIVGTGLGLAIAKEIMQAHSGQIHIESELGIGTTLTLLFPSAHRWGGALKLSS